MVSNDSVSKISLLSVIFDSGNVIFVCLPMINTYKAALSTKYFKEICLFVSSPIFLEVNSVFFTIKAVRPMLFKI